jgi:imidazolonepropionase-like amidohydrolase
MPVSERSVTAYEGARLIVGDGRVIDNATLVVEGTKIAQVGGAADVRVPAGATRVSLAAKTVMPMIIDTHVHLSETREALIRDLRQRAVPYWITTAAEGRKAVEEIAAQKADIVKIWVDDRDGKYKKLTPEMYGAIIDEAHKRGLRVTAHIYNLEDAKGLIRAGVDVFAHSIRDKDIDDELVSMFKQRPNLVLTPNLPDRGVKAD